MLPIMPWGGSVLAMIISLKNNARPRKKPFEDQKKARKRIGKANYTLRYKKVTPGELEKIKSSIQHSAKKERQKALWLISMLIFVLCSGFVYWSFKNNETVNERNSRIVIDRLKLNREVENLKSLNPNEQYDYLIECGNGWFNNENYTYAIRHFNNALILKPDEYEADLGLTKSYVYLCSRENQYCSSASLILKTNQEKYGETPGLTELETLLYSGTK